MSIVMEGIQEFVQLLNRMEWSDYLDILLVSYLIYRLIPLVRTPTMMRLTRTVVALVIIAWLTDVMKLYTLNWILSQFLAVGLLAFVILFQPELRRMLDHLGNVKLSKFFGITRPVQETDAMITQTCMACDIMSRKRVGALIVFARDQRLDEYFKTGTQIDGQVTEQLIRNIFFPLASLHDGAMIIRDGRIAAAGCVLPLSDSHRLSADLGTRHRAGVGMSEASDAVVVIVSEETGTISVAVGGLLKRLRSADELYEHLRKELCPAQQENTGVRAMLLEKFTVRKEKTHEKK